MKFNTFEYGEAVGGAWRWELALRIDDWEGDGYELKVVTFLLDRWEAQNTIYHLDNKILILNSEHSIKNHL